MYGIDEPYYASLQELMEAVMTILPHATIGEDNDGQIIIYSNLRISDGLTSIPADEMEPMPDFEGRG